MPQISVVMSVYNCEKYVGETIQSVIDQTFTDWEFIIINDASKDKSAEVIRSFDDDRIIFIDNKENKGQCANLNHGISLARGKYIARLDHDDLCYKDRFFKQFSYMEEHPKIDLLSSWLDTLVDGKIYLKKGVEIKSLSEMKFSHTFYNYGMAHSAFFIRKSALTQYDIVYDIDYKFCEDYRMVLQFMQYGEIFSLNESLGAYREFPEQVTQTIGKAIIDEEESRCRDEYMTFIGADEYLHKAIWNKLSSVGDYNRFIVAFKKYAQNCGLELDNAIIPKVMRDLFWNQRRTPLNLWYILKTYI